MHEVIVAYQSHELEDVQWIIGTVAQPMYFNSAVKFLVKWRLDTIKHSNIHLMATCCQSIGQFYYNMFGSAHPKGCNNL